MSDRASIITIVIMLLTVAGCTASSTTKSGPRNMWCIGICEYNALETETGITTTEKDAGSSD